MKKNPGKLETKGGGHRGGKGTPRLDLQHKTYIPFYSRLELEWVFRTYFMLKIETSLQEKKIYRSANYINFFSANFSFFFFVFFFLLFSILGGSSALFNELDISFEEKREREKKRKKGKIYTYIPSTFCLRGRLLSLVSMEYIYFLVL